MTNLLEISPQSVNLFSFILGMTFASFLSWYRRTAFMYIVAYFMGLAFYYGAIKPSFNEPIKTEPKTLVPQNQLEYTPPLPLPTPRSYK